VATTGGQSFWLNDRRVVVRTGTKSQTVNVCTRQNAPGEYEAVYRLPLLSAIAAPDVPEMADLHAFGTWLVETRNALREGPSGQPVVPWAAVGISAVDEAWLRVAVEKVEQAVDLLVDDFAEHPYRHRVEHSLHLQLYRALAATGSSTSSRPSVRRRYAPVSSIRSGPRPGRAETPTAAGCSTSPC
jgi:hypothetical protein